MWRFLETLDRRWIFLLVALTVIVPTLVTIPFPVPASNPTKMAYHKIESLKEGDFVILSFTFGPSSMAELLPQAKAVLRHCFRKKLRVALLSLWPDAPPMASETLNEVVESEEFRGRLRAGNEYVDLGFRQGYSLVILGMAENIPGFFQRDVRGEELANLPAMQGIGGLRDVALVVDFAAGDSTEWWITFANQRYGTQLAAGVVGVSVSQQYPFLNSGQLTGLIGGGVGAAEYESLVDAPGHGMRRVSTLSFVHFLVIALVVLGNVIYFNARRSGAERRAT